MPYFELIIDLWTMCFLERVECFLRCQNNTPPFCSTLIKNSAYRTRPSEKQEDLYLKLGVTAHKTPIIQKGDACRYDHNISIFTPTRNNKQPCVFIITFSKTTSAHFTRFNLLGNVVIIIGYYRMPTSLLVTQ